MAAQIHVGDTGTVFTLIVRDTRGLVPLANYPTRQMIFVKPNNTIVTKTATLTTDGTDGKMQYVTADGDLDATGLWKLQGYVAINSDNHWHTDVVTFQVVANIN
jgi:hypothetical protein